MYKMKSTTFSVRVYVVLLVLTRTLMRMRVDLDGGMDNVGMHPIVLVQT